MELINLQVGSKLFSYNRNHPIFNIPFIKNLISFESEKDTYDTSIPDVANWEIYVKYITNEINLDSVASDEEQGFNFVELIQFLMDQDTFDKFIKLRPEFFDESELQRCFESGIEEATIIKELYRRNKEYMIQHAMKNSYVFSLTLNSDLNMLDSSGKSIGQYVKENSTHLPMLSHFINFLDSCKSFDELEKRKDNILATPLREMLILKVDSELPDEVQKYKFSPSHDYMLGRNIISYRSGFYHFRKEDRYRIFPYADVSSVLFIYWINHSAFSAWGMINNSNLSKWVDLEDVQFHPLTLDEELRINPSELIRTVSW